MLDPDPRQSARPLAPRLRARLDDGQPRARRTGDDLPPAKAFVDYASYDGNIDGWQASEFVPPVYIYVNSGSAPAGRGVSPAERCDSQGLWGFVVDHALTPETAATTHQFWAVALARRNA